MADTYTQFLNLTKPEVGGSRDSWGTKVADNFDKLDANAKATDTALKATTAVANAALNRAGDTMTGGLGIFAENSQVSLNQNGGTYNGFAWNIMNFAGDGNLYFQDYQGGKYVDNAAYFTRAGDLVLGKGYGSVRAAIKAAQDTATGAANQKVAKAGDVMTGDLEIQKANASLWLHHPNAKCARWWVGADLCLRYSDQGGQEHFRIGNGGEVWTQQLGDLNDRIEARATTWADDRLAIARAEYGLKFDKTGGVIAGDVTLKKAWPGITLLFPSVLYAGWQLADNGRLNWINYDTGAAYFSIGMDGSVTTSQFGDLNNRIEGRAAAIADNRLATARAEYGLKLNKAGDSMTGDLIIRKAFPQLALLNDGVLAGGLMVGADARLYFRNTDTGVSYWSVGTDGSMWSTNIGDWSTRIENRAASYADDRLATATSRINNKSARLGYVGDRGTTDQAVWEGYSGSVVTGYMADSTLHPVLFRFRQLQMSDSAGNWYACSYT